MHAGLDKPLHLILACLGRTEDVQLFHHGLGNGGCSTGSVSRLQVAVNLFKDVAVAEVPEALNIGVGLAVAHEHPPQVAEGAFAVRRLQRVLVATYIEIRQEKS